MRLLTSATLAFALAVDAGTQVRAATTEPATTTPAAPDIVATIGPLHGAWLMDGKPALVGEPVPAGASFVLAQNSAEASIAIYAFDGRLVERNCPPDPACPNAFGLGPLGDTASIKSVVQDATKALPHYHFVYVPRSPQSPVDATPADGIARVAPDGAVDFGEIMRGVPPGPYRLVLRPLDPHASFAPAGDSIFKLFSWNGEPVSVFAGGVPEGLYSAQLFARDAPEHALGARAWAAVIGTRGEAAVSQYEKAQALAAKWADPEAKQIFLRSDLVNAAFPQSTPAPHAGNRHRGR